jgi:hypothetical protein
VGHEYRDAVWSFRGQIPPLDLLVLMEIADRTNGEKPVERGAWPSLATVAKAIGVCRWTVKGAAKRLELGGWITIERRERQTSIYRLGGRVLNTPPRVSDTPGVGCFPPGGRVSDTPEPRNRTTEDEPIPPLPLKGRGVEVDPLFEEWERCAEAAAGNASLSAPRIVKRTKARLGELRAIAEVLESEGATWAGLVAGFEAYEQPGHLTPLSADSKRLRTDPARIVRILAAGATGHGGAPSLTWEEGFCERG